MGSTNAESATLTGAILVLSNGAMFTNHFICPRDYYPISTCSNYVYRIFFFDYISLIIEDSNG